MPSPNTSKNEVIIRQQWDYLPHIEDLCISTRKRDKNKGTAIGVEDRYKQNCHVTRKLEREYLIDFFRRRKEGSLLVSGKRGVGKTSVVTSAILATQKLIEESAEEWQVIPVLVNAPNFEIRKVRESNGGRSETVNFLEFKRLVIQNLVRALYQAALRNEIVDNIDLDNTVLEDYKKSNKRWKSTNPSPESLDIKPKSMTKDAINLRNKISDLFRRAVAKILMRKSTNPSPESLDIKPKSMTKDAINLRNKISDLFRRAIAKDIVTQSNSKGLELEKYLQTEESVYQFSWSIIAKTVVASISFAAITAFFLPLMGVPEVPTKIISIISSVVPPTVAMSWTIKKTRTNRTESEKNASICYLYDYDLSTLQSELEETIRTLTDSKLKVVFIIDELDKIDEVDVMEVIKSLKSLFNSASALFVLITGDEFYNKVSASSEGRGKEYTLFSQKLFIRRPQFSEFKKFMDIIVDPGSSEPIVSLFEWDKIRGQASLSVNDEYLGKLRGAKIDPSDKGIVITLEKDGESYSTLIKDSDSEPDAVLKIKEGGDIFEFEFGVMNQGQNNHICTRRVSSLTVSYRDFQQYAGYESKGDFFDLYNVIRDHLFYSETDQKPRLKIELDQSQLMQARLHMNMTSIYSKVEYSHPSKWDKNDHLLSLMYDFIIKLSEFRGTRTRLKIIRVPFFRIVFIDENNTEVASIPRIKSASIPKIDKKKSEVASIPKIDKKKSETQK